jgi:hypothetical protein
MAPSKNRGISFRFSTNRVPLSGTAVAGNQSIAQSDPPTMTNAKVRGSIALQQVQHWTRQNSNCGAEILLMVSSAIRDGTEPRCFCGSIMIPAVAARAFTSGAVLNAWLTSRTAC